MTWLRVDVTGAVNVTPPGVGNNVKKRAIVRFRVRSARGSHLGGVLSPGKRDLAYGTVSSDSQGFLGYGSIDQAAIEHARRCFNQRIIGIHCDRILVAFETDSTYCWRCAHVYSVTNRTTPPDRGPILRKRRSSTNCGVEIQIVT